VVNLLFHDVKYHQQISGSTDLFGLKGDKATYLITCQCSSNRHFGICVKNKNLTRRDLVLVTLFAVNNEMIVSASDFWFGEPVFCILIFLNFESERTCFECNGKYFLVGEKLKKESDFLQILVEQTCSFKS